MKLASFAASCAAHCLLAGTAVGQNINLVQLSTSFDNPIGIDYHEPTNSLILSTNYSNGLPINLERIEFDGSHFQFSALSGLTEELKIATVRSIGNPGGFVVGDVFTGNGVDGQIVRVTNGGATISNPWVDLPGAGNGLMRGSLYIDRTGVFGGDLIIATTGGEVWRINSAGVPSFLVDVNTHLEGLITVPNDALKYGPLAGRIIAGAEGQSVIYAVDANGGFTTYNVGVKVEDIDFIRPNEAFYGVNYGTSRLLAAPASTFAGMAGEILLTQEYPNANSVGLYHMFWNGVSLVAQEFTLAPGSEVPGQWEHVTLAPLGVIPFPTCEIDPAPPFAASVGVPLVFTVTGKDANPADIVTITASGVPAGASLVPPLPVAGNPVSTTFTWIPGNGDTGTHHVVFTITDSGGLETICEVTIEVAECYLFFGFVKIDEVISPAGDRVVVKPFLVYPVTMETIPVIAIPANAALIGLHLYAQIGMYNPLVFPADPIKMSNGLDIVIEGNTTPYGPSSGMTTWVAQPALLGGALDVKFSIDG
ncbi:MAG: hypothetical protein HY812_07260 [Planctomycetes bacterium]|nr:hypothetical protein [Planctomycetota bacterium]